MLNIVLVEPEIPPNTGNIARTCAAVGARLHLVEPLGFDISEKAVRRAGLDYWHLVDLQVHHSLRELFERCRPENFWLTSAHAHRCYTDPAVDLSGDVWLFFGRESTGLPEAFLRSHPNRCIRIPIRAEARCLNLSNAVAVLTFEVMRRTGFPGLALSGSAAGNLDPTD